MKSLSRRGLVFGAAAFGMAGTAKVVAAEASAAQDRKRMMSPLKDGLPRGTPGDGTSPPPALMGQQMGRVITPGLPALGYQMDGSTKVFELIAQPVEVTITTGEAPPGSPARVVPDEFARFRPRPSQPKKMVAWGYNGQTPGPTLEATEGDRVRIVFRNELPEPTSVHWHGFELPYSEDGASGFMPFQARRPLLPGQTEEYEFDIVQAGTLMYHTGFNVMKQEGLGLGGMFICHPRNEERPPDVDFAILMQQWTFRPANPNPDVTKMEPSFATFNGLTAPTMPMLEVEQGARVRLRLANLSLMTHPIHLHGHVFKIVGTTGGPIQLSAQWRDVTVSIGPGESRDVEFVAWNPGTWRLHCHVLHHTMNQMPDQPMGIAPPEGMFTHIHVKPRDPNYDPRDRNAPWSLPTDSERR